jgi:hypothetical protein
VRMGKSNLHQKPDRIIPVQEALEGSERRQHLFGRGWHEGRLGQRAAGGTDPVLAPTQLARGELSRVRPREVPGGSPV